MRRSNQGQSTSLSTGLMQSQKGNTQIPKWCYYLHTSVIFPRNPSEQAPTPKPHQPALPSHGLKDEAIGCLRSQILWAGNSSSAPDTAGSVTRPSLRACQRIYAG